MAYQPNVQALTATHIVIKRLFQEWLRDAQLSHDTNCPEKANKYANRAIVLAHFLAKLASYWDQRARDNQATSASTTYQHLPPKDSWQFGIRIGYYIRVIFNTDRTKEVGTTHSEGTCQKDFQALDELVWEHRVQIVDNIDSLRSASHSYIRRHCRAALLYVSSLSGPTWGSNRDVKFIQPWSLERKGIGKYGEEDIFWIPVVYNYIPKHISESIINQPTIFLPNRDNIIGLLKNIELLLGYLASFIARLDQYNFRSHLVAKKQAIDPAGRNAVDVLVISEGEEEGEEEAEDNKDNKDDNDRERLHRGNDII
ncbi:hypothetical protein BKA60DRAFT_603051 [Fusarium oxysporum]|nr:hypothetical protein BKA60DRAFT_603051 [Fusarium oxysporum]